MSQRLILPWLLFVGCAATPRPPAAPTPSATPLPDIEVTTLTAQKTSLRANLARRPALISLWATWCESCLTELGALDRLSTAATAKGGYVVAVSEGEKPEDVTGFVRRKALAYPQLIDEPFALSDAIGARTVPTTLVVDRAGNIVFRGGALDEAAMRAFDGVLGQN